VRRDLTPNYPYQRMIAEEIEHYSRVEVTEDLREGGRNDTGAWKRYWGHVAEAIGRSPFSNLARFLDRTYGGRGGPIEILSLGSGYCGNELKLARNLRSPYRIRCTDINESVFEEARRRAAAEGLALEFEVSDLNFLTVEPRRYHLVYAHAVLHHLINLEHVLDQIAGGLVDGGLLHAIDVVGENRKLLWPENELFVNALLATLPEGITRGLRVQANECDGMEGVRQEETVRLLDRTFTPEFAHLHGAFMRFVCTNSYELAACFDPQDPVRRRYLDFLIAVDDAAVAQGVLRPLELWGVFRPR
jgi:SAM-dependent methyltransferase